MMIALLAGIAPRAVAQTFDFVRSWPSNGPGRFPLPYPDGIAIDAKGNTFYADFATHCVGKVDSSGNLVTTWGGYGAGDGQFFRPKSVGVDSLGNVYVADFLNNRIQKFTSTGTYLTQWGSYGDGDGQFRNPVGVAVDSADNVYVVDSANARIEKFTSTGAYLTQWNSWGGLWTMVHPSGIAVDSADNVYVADLWTERFNICKFTPTGTFVAGWRLSGIVDGNFLAGISGSYLALDSANNLYASADVIESNSIHVSFQKAMPTGLYMSRWVEWRFGQGGLTTGMATDRRDYLHFGDPSNRQIPALAPSGMYVDAWHMWGG